MIESRPYQLEAIKRNIASITSGKRGGFLTCLPTGTGKSIVIAEIIRQIVNKYPSARILALTHVKELIAQNANKLTLVWPTAPFGIYSSGLRLKEPRLPIVFGGVASVVKDIEQFGRRDLVLIDESHLVSSKDDSMYGEIINKLEEINPQLVTCGFTATNYRANSGLLTEGKVFKETIYDLTGMSEFNKLIADGYICTLIPKRTDLQLNVSGVSMEHGDFNKKELEKAVDIRDINYLACKESIQFGANRKSWLVFASGIDHAIHLAEMLRNFGISAAAVHSKLSPAERDQILSDFRSGKLRCVVNNNVLTTGFDHPAIDFILMLRPTYSTGLWVQMLGRGTRPSPGKDNCLVLDFAQNTARLGPINDPVIPRKRGTGAPGVAPIRICDNCGVYNHASARVCYVCGIEFPRQSHIHQTASTAELVKKDIPEIVVFKVNRTVYSKFVSNGMNIMKVTYLCGVKTFEEIVCLEHSMYTREQAVKWWKESMGTDVAPPTVDEALKVSSHLRMPSLIHVIVNRKYPKILKREFAA